MDLYNIIGFVGTALYVIGYALLQTKKIENGITYILFNLFGAVFVLISLVKYWNAPSFAIQSIWIVISLVGIYNHLKGKEKAHTTRED